MSRPFVVDPADFVYVHLRDIMRMPRNRVRCRPGTETDYWSETFQPGQSETLWWRPHAVKRPILTANPLVTAAEEERWGYLRSKLIRGPWQRLACHEHGEVLAHDDDHRQVRWRVGSPAPATAEHSRRRPARGCVGRHCVERPQPANGRRRRDASQGRG